MSDGPVGHYLAPPTFRVALAAREPLLDRLRERGERRVVLVDAPAGYGKTWLLSRWHAELRRRGVPVVWLGVEDPDAAHFLMLVVAGLVKAGIEAERFAALAAQGLGDTPLASLVGSVADALCAPAEPPVLFVDDVHRLSREAIVDVLAKLIAEAPPGVRFACSGRDFGALPRAALRSRGELFELGVDDLRFDLGEARELLPALPPGRVQSLLQRTEGWPVALQLARLWIEARPQRSELLESFSGRTLEIAEYLTEQVLGDLGQGVREVLAAVSVLDALNPELVAAVTGDERAWGRLLDSGSLEHFLVPLDEERYWFRLHHLLLDFLRAERRRRGDDERALHGAASVWFERHGGLRDAVRHAVLADDIARAAALVERTGGWELVLTRGTGLMRALLAEIPAARAAEFPRIALFQAFLAVKDGDTVRGLREFEAIAAAERDRADGAMRRDLLMVGHLIGRYVDRAATPADLEALYRDYDALDPGDDVGRATLANTACLLALALGDMCATLAATERAVREMRRIGSVLGLNYCLIHLGMAHWQRGARREAEAIWREAAALAEENFGADSGLKAIADVHLALALHARGDVAGAAARLEEALLQVESADGWLDVYAEGYECALDNLLARGQHAAADALVERMAATARRRGLERLDRLATILRARLALRRLAARDGEGAAVVADAAAIVAVLDWRPGRLRERPSQWREHHAAGSARAAGHLLCAEPTLALNILDDLESSARADERHRQRRQVGALKAAARLASGEGDGVLPGFLALLDEALREDDTQFLLDHGPVLLPLLQRAWAWSRDHWSGSSCRQALADAVTTLARSIAARDAADALSARELEVLAELARGAPNKVIARQLQMTENTVKYHLKNVFQKLGVRHRAEAIQAARARGLLR